MDTNKMRDQFEAAFAEETARRAIENDLAQAQQSAEIAACTVFAMNEDRDGASYRQEHFASAWWAWQASREAVMVVLPKVVGFEGAYDSMRHHEFVPTMSDLEDADEIFGLCRSVEVREAIESQGLNVRMGEAQ